MSKITCRGLPDYGLPLIPSSDPAFAALAAGVQSHWGSVPEIVSDRAAVLRNQSGKAIVALVATWKFAHSDRYTHLGTLGSNAQLEVLMGRIPVPNDRFGFILPGSVRLITEEGIFGDNSDVLPLEPAPRDGGFVRSRFQQGTVLPASTGAELVLDAVFMEDGLCLGPDEGGIFEAVSSDIEQQISLAQQLAARLREGASAGELFETLRPLARRPAADRPGWSNWLQSWFAHHIIHTMIQESDQNVLATLDGCATPPRLALRRPATP